ncbi:hypothetical protein GLYMA_12G110500v4 [Glycine max]|nr:hypothetical protein GLYMA_12G110500v4 [Glycine max]KAH1142640.1 hypothetical protein GYH30_033376 [Glycine max]
MNAPNHYERFVVLKAPKRFLMKGTRRSSMRHPSPSRDRSTLSATSSACSCTETPMSYLPNTSFFILFNTKLLSGFAIWMLCYLLCFLDIVHLIAPLSFLYSRSRCDPDLESTMEYVTVSERRSKNTSFGKPPKC